MLGFDEKLGLKNQIYFTHRSNRSNNIRRDYSDGICSQSKYIVPIKMRNKRY